MMTRGNISPLEGGHNPEMIQQPRRFACDRCRMQKLRCERDIWRPSLMPCKRCRKARMTCTISSMDRTVSKRPKEKIVTPAKVSKTIKESPKQMQTRSPGLELAEPSPEEAAITYHNKMMTGGLAMSASLQMTPDNLQPEDCFSTNASFDGYTVPVFSGLVTPPSMESERELQMPLQMPTYLPHNQDWTSLRDSQCLDYEDRFPCLDDREQHWDGENLRRLLDTNMHLLDCQQMVSQKLIMLGNMSPTIAVNNLETALQSVLGYSQQFLEVVKFSIPREVTAVPPCHLATSFAANGMIVSIPTPSASRRPSGFEGAASEPETALAQSEPINSATFVRQARFDDVHISLILAIINCYACLMGSYHLIFSYLLQELMASSPQPSPIFPNFTFPTLPTDGEPGRELQLRLIFNNSMRMLAHLEASLGLPEQYSVTGSVACLPGQPRHHDGILCSPSAMVFLDSLASQGFGLCVNGLATGKNSSKEIVQAINQFLDPPA